MYGTSTIGALGRRRRATLRARKKCIRLPICSIKFGNSSLVS
jgi:hypothetical protein